MDKANDLNGQRFGRLTVICFSRIDKHRKCRWICKCECGKEIEAISSQLVTGKTKSCGCLRREKCIERNTTHAGSKTRLFYVWNNIIDRCNNPKNSQYQNYGGRGIALCKEWSDFAVFQQWALENGYEPTAPRNKCTLDRINNNGNYEPSNCRWVDMAAQNRNSRRTHNITFNGKTKCLTDWAMELQITPSALEARLKHNSIEIALSRV